MLPFNKKYFNDIAFVIDRPLVHIGIIGIGRGTLIPSYGGGCNLAKTCWLVDDYCIQFNAFDESMYVYDLFKHTSIKYALNSLTKEEIEWMSGCCYYSTELLLKVRKLRTQPTSIEEELLGNLYASFYNVLFCTFNRSIPEERLEALNQNIELITYQLDLEYKNNAFYRGNKVVSWGEIARIITNTIKGL